MLSIFRQNTISSAVAMLLVSILAKIHSILHPPDIESLGEFYRGALFSWYGLKSFFIHHPKMYMLLSVLITIAFGFYLNYLVNREKLFARKSYIPGLVFVLMTSLLPVFDFFSFQTIANYFILSSFFKLGSLGGISRPRRAVFDIGLMLGLASAFYFPTILLLLFIPFLLLLFRPFLLQEFLAYLLGFLAPWYLGFAWLFIAGHFPKSLSKIYLHADLPLQLVKLQVFVSITLFSVIAGFYSLYLLNKYASRNSVQVRKKWNMITIYAVLAMIVGGFSVYFPSTPWIVALTPFCILLSQALHNNREKSNNFTLLTMIILLIVVQWLL